MSRYFLIIFVLLFSGCSKTVEEKVDEIDSSTLSPKVVPTEEVETDVKAPNSKYQPYWKQFKDLDADELFKDYKIMSNPKQNIPLCETDQSKVSDKRDDKIFLFTMSWTCRHPSGGYGYAVEPGFLARRSKDIKVNKGFTVTPDTSLPEVKEQIKLYLKLNRNLDADLYIKGGYKVVN